MRRVLSTFALCFMTTMGARGGEEAKPAAPPATPTVPPAAAAADDDRAPTVEPRERSIYIPYEQLRKVFEKKGRGVFVPYEEYMGLWRAARANERRRPQPTPPADYLITDVSGEVSMGKEVLLAKAIIRLEVLRKGWTEIELGMGDVAITRATLDDAPARLVSKAGKGHVLLVHQADDVPRAAELHIEFGKAFEKAPGRNSVTFSVPPAAVSQWEVRIPEPGVEVAVKPALASTRVTTADGAAETRLLAFVGASPTVRIEWTPKAEGATGLTALTGVLADHRIWLDEGLVRTRVELLYTITRAEVQRLAVEVPAEERIVNVFDPNAREWTVAEGETGQTINVELFEPAKDQQRLVVELERLEAGAAVDVAQVRAVGAGRQQGTVVVNVGEGLRAEAGERTGLLQLDAKEPAAQVGGQAWTFAYRYAALPFGLSFQVEKIRPRILAEVATEVRITPEEVTLEAAFVYTVEKTGTFQFLIRTPPAFDVRSVQGTVRGEAAAADVDSHYVLDDGSGLTAVDLSRQAHGRVALTMQLHRRLDEPDLLSPTGRVVALPLALPRADPGTTARETGRVDIFAPESLRVAVGQNSGLRPSARGATGSEANSPADADQPELILSFAYSDGAVSLTLQAERRRPHATARQLLTARAEAGVVTFEARLRYGIQYSGLKRLRVDIPVALQDQIRLTTPGLQIDKGQADADIADLQEGYVPWSLSGETEFIGTVDVDFVWEQKIAEPGVGAGVTFDIARILPRGVDRAWGQIVLAKAESVDLVPAEGTSGLRPIDPQYDLAPGETVPDAARAFEFHSDWSLSVTATRYGTRDVKATSIERGVVSMVATRGDMTSVQAVYRMRSARQRLRIQLPENVTFDAQPLRLNGRQVPLEEGGAGEFLIPLVGQEPGSAFLLELRYVVAGEGKRFQCPAFPDEPAAQKIYLSVFLPQEWAYLGSRGPWHAELAWVYWGFTCRPRGKQSNDSLMAWVTDGVTEGQEALSSFATDGTHVLFSSLRPTSGAGGVLRIAAMRRAWLNLLVLVLGMGIGFGLLRSTLPQRVLVIGVVATGLLVAAVFVPSLTQTLISNAAVAGGLIVLIAWGLQYFLVTRAEDPVPRETAIAGVTGPAPDTAGPAQDTAVAAPDALDDNHHDDSTARESSPPPASPLDDADETSTPAEPSQETRPEPISDASEKRDPAQDTPPPLPEPDENPGEKGGTSDA